MRELNELLLHDTKCNKHKADFHIMCYMCFSFLCLIDLKLLNNDIGHLRNIKDEVGLKRKQLAEANNRMNVNRDQINKYNGKLEPITERLNTINAREADITKLYTAKGMCIYIYIICLFNSLMWAHFLENWKLKYCQDIHVRTVLMMWEMVNYI